MAEQLSSAARVLRIMKAMSGHTLLGISNGELAKALDETPSAITRALQTMIDEGFAMKLDNGRFALSVSMLQIAQRTTNELHNMQLKTHELTQRISAGTY